MELRLIFTIVSTVLLLGTFSKGPSAVWGGATGGAVVGLIVGLVSGGVGNALIWGFSIGTISGAGIEILTMVGNKVGDKLKKA